MSVTVNEAGEVLVNCTQCGAEMWRKNVRCDMVCKKCRNRRVADWKKFNGKVPSVNSPCETCQYQRRCKQDLFVLAPVPGEGWIMMPLRCFKDHPAYDVSEWKLRRQEARA